MRALRLSLLLSSLMLPIGLAVPLLDARAEAPPPPDALRPIDKLLDEAGRSSNPRPLRASFGHKALSLLGPLLAARPDDAGLHWLAAMAWTAVAEERGPAPPLPDAAAHVREELQATRRLAPDGGHAIDVAMELALLDSKQGRYAEALAEYDRALEAHALGGPWCCGGKDTLEQPPARTSMILANAGEILMALGRLDEALVRYRRAVEHTPRGRALSSLPWWGLAVALDRDRQLERSRGAVAQALARDPEMGDLEDPSVFFVPVGEKEYYLALGYIARDKPEAAVGALEAFLKTQPRALHAERARSHLAALNALLATRREANP